MQTEVNQAGWNATVEGIVAEGALRQLNELPEAGRREFTDEFLPRKSAMRGLAAAIPVSLSLWVIVGLLLWAIVR